jgi:prevent-host-death family protein
MSVKEEESMVISLGQLRGNLGDTVNRVAFADERVFITRNGKKVAAIVSIEDVELLDELEMRADVEALRQARAEDDGTRISLEELLAEGS